MYEKVVKLMDEELEERINIVVNDLPRKFQKTWYTPGSTFKGYSRIVYDYNM
jgi:CRISPR/Cas system CSM-associated protein Csm5 (group 7 of RAMP superfamily)